MSVGGADTSVYANSAGLAVVFVQVLQVYMYMLTLMSAGWFNTSEPVRTIVQHREPGV